MALDLNIDNYEFPDLLNLFNIPLSFGENDMKKAKRHVLKMHPDKSGLPKEYFLFYSKAFKILLNVFDFREKANRSESMDIDKQNIEYLDNKVDKYNKAILDDLKERNKLKPAEFNTWFNELFNRVKLTDEFGDGGYGDWLSSYDNSNELEVDLKHKKMSKKECDDAFYQKKRYLRDTALANYAGISEYNDQGSGTNLTNSQPTSYSSGLFSSLAYEDLRKAHEESVVPVLEEDFHKMCIGSFEDLRIKRQMQDLTPLSENESNEILNREKAKDTYVSSYRAFKLVKQDAEIVKANEKFWAMVKTLK